MKILKKAIGKLKKPGVAVTVSAFVLFAAALAGVIVALYFGVPVISAYPLYVVSFLLLCYLIYITVLYFKSLKPAIIRFANRYAFTKKFVSDYDFRTMIYAFGSFIINVGYAAFNLSVGIIRRQGWYIALSIYYMVLSIARGTVVARTRKINANKSVSEDARLQYKIKIYRGTGIMLLVLTVALNIMLWVMNEYPGQTFSYQGNLIYVVAAYTFYKVVMAIHNLIKVRNSKDFAVKAVRNINFTTALVAVLSLQTALLSAYAENGDYRWATMFLGTAICAFAVVLGIFMIIRSVRRIKKGAVDSREQDNIACEAICELSEETNNI